MRFHLIRLLPSIAALLPGLIVALPAQAAALLRNGRLRLSGDGPTANAKTGRTASFTTALFTAARFAPSERARCVGIHAKCAPGALPVGSAPWQQAADVLIAANCAEKRK
jgi:hypothetical protein